MRNLFRQLRRWTSRKWDNFMDRRGYVRKQYLPEGEGWLAVKDRRITLELMVRPEQSAEVLELATKLGQVILDSKYDVASQYKFAVNHIVTMLVRKLELPLTKNAESDKLSV